MTQSEMRRAIKFGQFLDSLAMPVPGRSVALRVKFVCAVLSIADPRYRKGEEA